MFFEIGDGGKEFTIICHNLSQRNIYIGRAELNGQEYHLSRLPVEVITAGGTLHLYMTSRPNTGWGTK